VVDLLIEVDVKGLERFAVDLERELEKAVIETALYIEGEAKEACPVDTGFLRNSIHTVGHSHSTYAKAQAKASKGKLRRTGRQLVTVNPPPSAMEATVVVGAEYGLPVEYGHFAKRGTSRMSTRSDTAKGPRRTAQRISDRSYGTYVQGRLYLTRAMLAGDGFFKLRVNEAIRRAIGRAG
jgi:hypothetical protein